MRYFVRIAAAIFVFASVASAQVKISALPVDPALSGAAIIPMVDNGQTVQDSLASIRGATAVPLQTNLFGICAVPGSETGIVQYLQECPGTTIAELLNSTAAGQVATLWSNTSFSKQLELCLDIAAGDCEGEVIQGYWRRASVEPRDVACHWLHVDCI